jgi:uncharacterized Zn finger protein
MAWWRPRRSQRSSYFDEYPPYVPVAERRKSAAAAAAKLKKKGQALSPVEVSGRKIASTFWGNAWCENLERYSDYANRLPRGRSYVRNGSVIDLRIEAGEVTALVQGSSLYTIKIGLKPVEPARWSALVKECTGKIDSVVELLAGKLSSGVMELITREKTGLFPAPSHISMSCSCPDWATMCKHVAAVLYGVGARLDQRPELLFLLRGADPSALVAEVAKGGLTQAGKARAKEKSLKGADLSSVFGIDVEDDAPAPRKPGRRKKEVIPAPPPPPPASAPVKLGRRKKEVIPPPPPPPPVAAPVKPGRRKKVEAPLPPPPPLSLDRHARPRKPSRAA